jgi:hypothetical protein
VRLDRLGSPQARGRSVGGESTQAQGAQAVDVATELPYVPEPNLTKWELTELRARMDEPGFWDYDPNEPDPFEEAEATGGTEAS